MMIYARIWRRGREDSSCPSTHSIRRRLPPCQPWRKSGIRSMDATPFKADAWPQVLVENVHLLPTHGRALDVACGLGAGSIFLARHGLKVVAWDISPVAIA